MTVADHERLLDCVVTLAGIVLLSGYPSELYDNRLAVWHRVEHSGARDSAANPGIEVLWLNASAAAGSLHVAAA